MSRSSSLASVMGGGDGVDVAKLRALRAQKKYPNGCGGNRRHHEAVVWVQNLLESQGYQVLMSVFIFLVAVQVGVGLYVTASANQTIFDAVDLVVTILFTIELALKVFAQGPNPHYFVLDQWNNFDAVIVAASYVPIALQYGGGDGGGEGFNGRTLVALRVIRLIRIVKLVRIIPQLRILVMGLAEAFNSIGYISIILALVFYVYAVVGTFLFRANDPILFGSLGIALITLFRSATLEDWSDVMYLESDGCDVAPALEYAYQPEMCTDPQAQPVASVLYFVSFEFMANLLILNLFIGVIVLGVSKAKDRLEEEHAIAIRERLKAVRRSRRKAALAKTRAAVNAIRAVNRNAGIAKMFSVSSSSSAGHRHGGEGKGRGGGGGEEDGGWTPSVAERVGVNVMHINDDEDVDRGEDVVVTSSSSAVAHAFPTTSGTAATGGTTGVNTAAGAAGTTGATGSTAPFVRTRTGGAQEMSRWKKVPLPGGAQSQSTSALPIARPPGVHEAKVGRTAGAPPPPSSSSSSSTHAAGTSPAAHGGPEPPELEAEATDTAPASMTGVMGALRWVLRTTAMRRAGTRSESVDGSDDRDGTETTMSEAGEGGWGGGGSLSNGMASRRSMFVWNEEDKVEAAFLRAGLDAKKHKESQSRLTLEERVSRCLERLSVLITAAASVFDDLYREERDLLASTAVLESVQRSVDPKRRSNATGGEGGGGAGAVATQLLNSAKSRRIGIGMGIASASAKSRRVIRLDDLDLSTPRNTAEEKAMLLEGAASASPAPSSRLDEKNAEGGGAGAAGAGSAEADDDGAVGGGGGAHQRPMQRAAIITGTPAGREAEVWARASAANPFANWASPLLSAMRGGSGGGDQNPLPSGRGLWDTWATPDTSRSTRRIRFDDGLTFSSAEQAHRMLDLVGELLVVAAAHKTGR
jgi:voltage-gated sodium channel